MLRTNIFLKYKNNYFLETGSYMGNGIENAVNAGFDHIYSIELSDKYFNICKDKFSSKLDLFKGMYHICIENSKSDYYFSEKLIDCLLCKTIPIYYGCKKISDYFNTDSILIANSVDEIISICNTLDEDFYNKNKDNIMMNYNESLKWIAYDKRLYNKIMDIYYGKE